MTTKEKIMLAVCAILCLALISIGLFYPRENHSQIYELRGRIIEIHHQYNYMMVEDTNGNMWQVDKEEGFALNTKVTMEMNNNGTPNILDDIVVKINVAEE